MGVLITLQQYERGYYTAREAATICQFLGSVCFLCAGGRQRHWHGGLFSPMYACVIGIGFVCALIAKLPPLSGLKDEFCPGVEPQGLQDFSNYQSLWSAAVHEALARAGRAPTLGELIPRIGRGIAGLVILIPVVMGLGTAALILAEYTPLFNWLGLPLIAVLNLFGLAEADAAAPLMFVSFAICSYRRWWGQHKRADSICRRYGFRVSAHLYVGSRCIDYQVENTSGFCPHWRHLPDSDGDFPTAGCLIGHALF